ncbi:MAG: thiamine pyrophosphate-binding protein, partial [Bacteroidetes bacterium]|nr:thiamine pyrophosphate-binding protein [Bacteroidota bacterium]
ARGAIDENHPLAVPMTYIDFNDNVRKNADLILTLGSRMGETDWWGKMPNWGNPNHQKMIQVDIDDEILGRNKPIDLAINADVKSFLQKLSLYLETLNIEPKNNIGKYLSHKDNLQKKLDKHLEDLSSPMITAHIAKICQESFNDDAIAVFDGGNTAIWANFYHKCTSKNFLLGTAKMGMLGAGVSQVLGAAATNINRQAYCIIGDGAMGFHVQEIETAVRNKLNVIYIVVCDKQWGMVKMSQQIAFKPLKTIIKKSLDEGETVNADLGEIKFDDLAKSMGAHGERVNNPNDFKETLKKCIALKRCCVIHVDVDPVKHMWAPSLMHFKKMHNEPKG